MSTQQRRQNRQRSQRRQKRQRGGDAAAWTGAVYGPADAQTSTPGYGNLIAANNLSGVNMCTGGVAANAAAVTGGGRSHRRRRQQKQGGKGVLMDVAVPAVLLYANQMVRPRRKTMHKRHKKNFSRKFRRH